MYYVKDQTSLKYCFDGGVCPANYILNRINTNLCVSVCLESEYEHTVNKTCEDNCNYDTSNLLHFTDSDTNLRYCVDTCPGNRRLHRISNHECTSYCNVDEY